MSIIADRKWWFMLIGAAALIACGSAADSAALGDFSSDDAGANGGTDSNPTAGDSGATPANVGSATSSSESGIIVVHASRNLPAFRLCVPTHSNFLPLPYDQLMPNSNVVGVDVGTAVHLAPFAATASGSGTTPAYDAGAPVDSGATDNDGGEGGIADAGTQASPDAGPPASDAIYVIDEKVARQFYPAGVDASTWPNCGVLVSVLQANGLEGAGLYTVTHAPATASTPESPPVGTLDTSEGVSLLVLEGCLPDPALNQAACGTTYNPTTGNLSYRIILNLAQPANTDAGPGFSFQAIQLSPRVDSDLSANQTVTLSFGPLKDAASGVTIGESGSPPLAFGTPVPADSPLTVPFTPSGLSDYDNYGFALTAGASDGVSQSLATIQAQSSPTDLPQTFYLLPSNFVVLIIGDSQVAATANGPGASLHLLAVPVRNPDADAGTSSSGSVSTDGG